MGLVDISVADAKAAAKKLGKATDGETQVDAALRNCAEKNAGGKITVPQQLADRVKQLLPSAAESSAEAPADTGDAAPPRTNRKPKADSKAD